MSMSRPLMSIGIPASNVAALIARAIGSTLGQTCSHVEVLTEVPIEFRLPEGRSHAALDC
jgi:hypothetical protein